MVCTRHVNSPLTCIHFSQLQDHPSNTPKAVFSKQVHFKESQNREGREEFGDSILHATISQLGLYCSKTDSSKGLGLSV